jgi:ubiquinone/menaquinone biosynthesis C-methylase UbiE
MKLNLGCGGKRIEGFVGVDKIKTKATDKIWDLDVFPYPFSDNSVEEVLMDNVLEHLEDVILSMEELYRICKPGAKVRINVPYFKSNSAFTDPTHKHFFTENSFKYFDKNHSLHFYTKAIFKVNKAKLVNYSSREYRDKKHILRKLIPCKKILNYFFFNMYDEIQFELECIKD